MAVFALSEPVLATDHRLLVKTRFRADKDAPTSGTATGSVTFTDLVAAMHPDSPLRRLFETLDGTDSGATANELVLENPQLSVRLLPTYEAGQGGLTLGGAVSFTYALPSPGYTGQRPGLLVFAAFSGGPEDFADVYVEINKLVPTRY